MTNLALLLALHFLAAPSSAPAPAPPARDSAVFRLHKFEQPIGIERSILVTNADGSTDVRTTFSFTDRTTSVPLASNLTLAADGTPRRFAIWGSTSRQSTVDDKVELADGKLTIEQSGASRVEAARRDFFVGSGYAPVILTELLWRHWSARGRPRSIPLYPSGEAMIEPRGSETITGDDGKPHKLDRYALRGRAWGRETFWVDDQGKLAAYKGVDAEFDHFEAIRRGYQDALGAFVKSAAAAGPSARVAIPAGAKRVDVAGKTIVPGLWDMHAHFEQVEWGPVYLAAGVTTARDCGNEMDFITSVRDTVDAGSGLGPRLLLACIVDGYGTGSIGTSRLRDESEIPALIQRDQDARCSQVKIYSSLEPKLIAPLARAAHAAGLSVTGHVPIGIGAVAGVEAGMDQINHVAFVVRALLPVESPDAELSNAETDRALASLDFQSEKTRSTLALLKARGVIVDPTISLSELFTHDAAAASAFEPGLAKVAPQLKEALETMGPSPDRADAAALRWKANLGTVRALHQAGIPIVAGTDQSVPGHSLHREIELYVEAGFTPMEALQAATIVSARALKRDKDLGTVETGKIADFIVVEGDPMADIRNLRKITTVVKDGRAYDPAKLWTMVGFKP